jgi:N4-gp56 family major capsid protein
MSEKLLLRAFPSNTLSTYDASAGYLNPQIWNRKIEEFAQANLVLAPLGVQNDEMLNKPGTQLNIAVDVAITADSLSDTVTITAQALTYTQVTVTPTEYGGAIQITRKELDRAFNNLLDEKASAAGYALAKAKDKRCYEVLVAGTGSTLYPNSVTVDTDLASTDIMSTDLIADGINALRLNDRDARYLVIHPYQENELLKTSDFIDASKYGGREVVMNGEIGKYLGLRVFSTTQATSAGVGITSSDTGYNALILGPRAFILARKRLPTIDSKYEPLDRAFTVAYVEDWQAAVLNANEIVTLVTYA